MSKTVVKESNMLDKKKIVKEAYEKLSSIAVLGESRSDFFLSGVEYGMEELIKKLWHEVKETPEANKYIITKFGYGNDICYEIDILSWLSPFDETWETYCKNNDIKAWCYIEDILPNK